MDCRGTSQLKVGGRFPSSYRRLGAGPFSFPGISQPPPPQIPILIILILDNYVKRRK